MNTKEEKKIKEQIISRKNEVQETKSGEVFTPLLSPEGHNFSHADQKTKNFIASSHLSSILRDKR